MSRAIVFIDHQNFEIAYNNLYQRKGAFIDCAMLPKKVVEKVQGCELIKTYMFVPSPMSF